MSLRLRPIVPKSARRGPATGRQREKALYARVESREHTSTILTSILCSPPRARAFQPATRSGYGARNTFATRSPRHRSNGESFDLNMAVVRVALEVDVVGRHVTELRLPHHCEPRRGRRRPWTCRSTDTASYVFLMCCATSLYLVYLSKASIVTCGVVAASGDAGSGDVRLPRVGAHPRGGRSTILGVGVGAAWSPSRSGEGSATDLVAHEACSSFMS